jgi:hypothetical protein
MVTSILTFLSLPLLMILAEHLFVKRIFSESPTAQRPHPCPYPPRLNHGQTFPDKSHSHQ